MLNGCDDSLKHWLTLQEHRYDLCFAWCACLLFSYCQHSACMSTEDGQAEFTIAYQG